MPPQGQGQEVEVQELSPHSQEEESSPSAPKKRNMKTPIKRTRRQKVIRKVIPFTLVLEVILKGEE